MNFTSREVTRITRTALISILLLLAEIECAKLYKAAIVESPSNYGFQPNHFAFHALEKLALKRQPSSFIGPSHMRHLKGRCFSLNKDNYEWELCPFDNATQTEIDISGWNPYRGVLGVWAGWNVDVLNNRFVSMAMTDGDDCGSKGQRGVDVLVECGGNTTIVSVTEPKTCHYVMTLASPVFCSERSLFVYPSLKEDERLKWDQLFTEKEDGVLTVAGYENAVKNLLRQIGLFYNSNDTVTPLTPIKAEASRSPSACDFEEFQYLKSNFDSLTKDYERLRKEHDEVVEQLTSLRRERTREPTTMSSKSSFSIE